MFHAMIGSCFGVAGSKSPSDPVKLLVLALLCVVVSGRD